MQPAVKSRSSQPLRNNAFTKWLFQKNTIVYDLTELKTKLGYKFLNLNIWNKSYTKKYNNK